MSSQTPQKTSAGIWAESLLLQLPLRLFVGGLFAFAAYNKIGTTQSFANSIKGFQIIDAEKHGHLIITAAYTMPWVEMIAGVLLVLGFWTRASAAVIGVLLVGFIAGLMRVILDDSISADCSCFGKIDFVCPPGVGWCQVIRNLVLLIPTAYLVWRQGGILALDRIWSSKNSDTDPEWTVDKS